MWQKHFNVWKLERKKNEEIKGQISSSSLNLVYTIHLPTVHVCTKCQSSRHHSYWQKCDEKFQCWKLERKKNEEIKGWIRAAAWFWYTWYICPLSTCVPIFKLLGLTVPEKSVMKSFKVENWRKRKNEEIKGQISSSNLIPVYMIHLPTVHVCTKFQSSRPHSSWEKCDEKFQSLKLERKINEEIKGWIKSSSLIPVYTIHLPTAHVCTKFQSSRPHSSQEKRDEKF